MSVTGDQLDGIAPDVVTHLSSHQQQTARRCLLALGILGAGSMLGTTSFMYLVNHYPLILIALSPIGRHLILVAPIVNPFAFIAVAVGRRMLFYAPSFLLGRSLGPFGIVWLEQRAPRVGRFFRFLERLFGRAPRTVVLCLPGPGVSTIAGSSGMDARVFATLICVGLTIRMVALLAIAEWAREPLEAVLAWIDEHWVPGTILIATAVGAYQLRIARRRASGKRPSQPDSNPS